MFGLSIGVLITDIVCHVRAQEIADFNVQSQFEVLKPFENCSDAAFAIAIGTIEKIGKIDINTSPLSIIFGVLVPLQICILMYLTLIYHPKPIAA